MVHSGMLLVRAAHWLATHTHTHLPEVLISGDTFVSTDTPRRVSSRDFNRSRNHTRARAHRRQDPGSPDGIASGYWLHGRGSILGRGKKMFSSPLKRRIAWGRVPATGSATKCCT
jgi:hypothetical protein